MQHNVKTMKDQMQQNTYEVLLHKMKIHIVGFQETQNLTSEVTVTGNQGAYIIARSARTGPRDMGCELWLSTKLPFGTIDGEPSFLHPDHILVLAQEPRLLVLLWDYF